MQIFRKLSHSIFFKIILAFVALSFVLFGISNFILGVSNTWVAKIGGDSISYNQFNSALKADRDVIIASSGEREEVVKYLESDRFKSDVLGRLVNQFMIKKLSADFDVVASKKIILESIAKDPAFRNESGKFDNVKFEEFLKRNGLNEERYVREISNNITAMMILQSFSLFAPVNNVEVSLMTNFKEERRVADVVTVTSKDVGEVAAPSDQDLEKFYNSNQAKYALPEFRKVSYLTFSAKNFAKDMQISDEEIKSEYEKNKDQFTRPETRNLFNVVFEKEEEAKNFLSKFEAAIGSDKSKSKSEFEKLAKDLAKRDLKKISLNKIAQRDLMPQVGEPVFKLALNDHSQVIESPLGFHVFLVTEIKAAQPLALSEVKDSLKNKLLQGREEKVLQDKITKIDDALLTSNSLAEVSKKFGLELKSESIEIDQNGRNQKGEVLKEAAELSGFSANAFAQKEKQASKVFQSQNGKFYALFIDEVVASKQQELSSIKSTVLNDYRAQKRQEMLRELAKKIADEIKENPSSAAQVAAKHKVRFDQAREYPRIIYLDFQGQQIPYQDQFVKDLFSLKVGEATSVGAQADDQFVIGILRQIKKSNIDGVRIEQAKVRASEEFRNEIMSEYNAYLMSRFPVKTNDKVFGKKEE